LSLINKVIGQLQLLNFGFTYGVIDGLLRLSQSCLSLLAILLVDLL
jgi:hypothetical protein